MSSTTSGLRLLRTALAAALVLASGAAAPGAAPAQAAVTYRAQYHFTVPDRWMNDPQRPVYIDGKFHYYYLYNADYPTEVGTAWRLATTSDGVAFADQGIAAPKKTNANHDLWSGSAVVDTANTAGFGAGAVIQLVTQMDHPTNGSGPQAQFLWYSID
jgi:levanbiose-producing levanase